MIGSTMDFHKFCLIDGHLNSRTLSNVGTGGLFSNRILSLRQMLTGPRAMSSSANSRGEDKLSSRERPRAEELTLRMIPGIGLKYEALLCSKGITTVKDLTKAFFVENQGSQTRMIGYLQVGNYFCISFGTV